MPGPGEYVVDRTEGITRVEDLTSNQSNRSQFTHKFGFQKVQ